MQRICLVGIFLGLLACSDAWAAEEFGRLFTTPGQRQQLDELRRTQSDIKVEVQDAELAIDQGPAVETNQAGELRLRGLVHRNDGKNTAWINDSNSYEGDLTSQYTNVKEDSVAADHVVIEMGAPNNNQPLKVGQSYNPGDGTVHDLIPEPAAAGKPAPGQDGAAAAPR